MTTVSIKHIPSVSIHRWPSDSLLWPCPLSPPPSLDFSGTFFPLYLCCCPTVPSVSHTWPQHGLTCCSLCSGVASFKPVFFFFFLNLSSTNVVLGWVVQPCNLSHLESWCRWITSSRPTTGNLGRPYLSEKLNRGKGTDEWWNCWHVLLDQPQNQKQTTQRWCCAIIPDTWLS